MRVGVEVPGLRELQANALSHPEIYSYFRRSSRGPAVIQASEVVMEYAGIDRLEYPGNAFMSGLMQHTNLLWTGFYLAPTLSHPNTSWMTHLADLRAMGPGWGTAPLFVGQQHPSGPGSHVLTAAQGRQDALHAAQLADQAGFADETDLPWPPRIYLDIEIGGNLPPDLLAYVNAWCQVIRSHETSYLPAVYCSYKDTAAQLQAANPDLVFWVFNINHFLHRHDEALVAPGEFLKPDIATQSGFPPATAWQWIQDFSSITTTLPNGSTQSLNKWDLDVSLAPDPSYPAREFDSNAGIWVKV